MILHDHHSMDILKLPTPLRRCLLSHRAIITQFQRSITTEPHQTAPNPDLLHPFNPSSPKDLLTLTSSTLNSYTISIPPTPPQLKYASSFFHSSPPQFLFSAATFRSFPPSSFPEVAFLGRSNVGKSSLLNALFGRTKVRDAYVSKRPGRTRTMNGFGVAGSVPLGAAPKAGEKGEVWKRFPRGGLVVVDVPGYGSGSREEWGREIMKVLENRRQLRRSFVLVDAEHGLKGSDVDILRFLRGKGISYQIVLSKVDKLLYPGSKAPGKEKLGGKLVQLRDVCEGIRHRLDTEIQEGRRGSCDILCCSAEKGLDERQHNRRIGIDEVRWAVLSACGLECDEFGQTKSTKLHDINVIEEVDAARG